MFGKIGNAVFKGAVFACIAYVAVVLSSIPASLLLPSFEEVTTQRATSCYWTNAMLVFVECGSAVEAGVWKSAYYNAWTMAIYSPFIAMSSIKAFVQVLLAYAPAVFLLYVLIRIIKRTWSR
ncbi:hypothetical protein EOI86_16680 [Hwanghaeella grinnelliae]|uniref:Uncharacterized protein n=1 Tax=Hwanghaeella grinnelliae TaxID=2500179 RepID=A0A3S2Y3F6_9PROT|nr:hypothetical protein [Hwanghaeella grinnelliae]RVU36799.1 hypothetical protein EOI86_16680 [Hwanghaeella grinnelliae]